MIIIISVSIIAIIFTILDSLKIIKGGMKLGFILVTIASMIRYDYGNDYMGYYRDFQIFTNLSFNDILTFSELFKDVGWSLFCLIFKIFGKYGFYILVALISVFTNIVYYKFIIDNVDRRHFGLAMFVYLFTFDMFTLQLSMIRQGLAIAILVLSFYYIKRGKLLVPLLLCLVAMSFHKTAVVFLPFIFLGKIRWEKYGKWISLILLFTFILLFASSSLIGVIFGNIMSLEIFTIYEDSYGMEEGNQIGIRRYLEFIPFFVALFCIGQKSFMHRKQHYLVILSTISTLLFPFTTIIHLISRLCFYFSAFSVASIPITYNSINNLFIRYALLLIYIIITIYIYIDRFTNSVYTQSFAHYKTIFSVLF